MRTLVAKLSPNLSNPDPCNPIPILSIVETQPEDGKKILAFEFDRFISGRGSRCHIGPILLSEIKDLSNAFCEKQGQSSILDIKLTTKEINIIFYDLSEIKINIFNKKIETWIKPNQTLPKMFRGFLGTFQYFENGKRKIFR